MSGLLYDSVRVSCYAVDVGSILKPHGCGGGPASSGIGGPSGILLK
jgi:hypothetical protein